MTDQRRRSTWASHGSTGRVTVTDVYDASPEELWDAITDPERLARWIAEVMGDIRPGGRVAARFTSGWEGEGEVVECDAPRRLVVRWFDDETPTSIVAELAAEGGRTRLTVVDHGIPAPELPDHAAGWDVHLADLGILVAGRPREEWRQRWETLRPVYEAARPSE